MRRGRKFPSDLRSPSTFTPAAYRLDAFRINYRKGDLIGTYVYLAFQKPFRESPSSGTSHSRSRGKLHDTARPSACGKATLLRMIAGLDVHGEVKQMGADACLLLWMVQNAITTCKSDSLVGGNSKRMTLTPLSSSCVGSDSRRVISPSLTTPNFSVRRRMMSSRHRKQPLPWHCKCYSLRHTRDAHRASYSKTRKESQDPRDRKSSLRNAPRHRPCHRHHALGE